MLRGKAWIPAGSADALDAKRAAGDRGQAQGGAQDLATAFTVSTVDDHPASYPRAAHASSMTVEQTDPIDVDQRCRSRALLR
jgi:hypothetical protein